METQNHMLHIGLWNRNPVTVQALTNSNGYSAPCGLLPPALQAVELLWSGVGGTAARTETHWGCRPAGEQQAGTGLAVGTFAPVLYPPRVRALCSAAAAGFSGVETKGKPSG